MQVAVNGEPREVEEHMSLAALLRDLGMVPGRVAVEVNEEVVPRDGYGQRRLASGDRVEIVHFVGGG